MDRVRNLVLQHGWNSTAYQILNPGISHWFSSRAPAVVGFVPRARTWVVAGAPVCAAGDLPAVAHEFESQAGRAQCGVCYVAAGTRLAELFRESDRHSAVTIGTQPAWDPLEWPRILKSRASLRAQLTRAKNKGVTVSEYDPQWARHDPQLRRCLAEWIESRPAPPMHFLVEPAALDGELSDRRILVAQRDEQPVAYLLASPVPARQGYLVEQIIRSHQAPNGTAELLVDAFMNRLARSHCRYLTLGLIPLAEQADEELRKNPLWLRGVMVWARAHGQRFYHFRGLEQFKQKLCPTSWETIYAICNRPRFTPHALYSMLAAFSDGPLPWMIVRALARAAGTETQWLGEALWTLMGGSL